MNTQPDTVLVAEDEPTPVRGEPFVPYEQSADARLDRADAEIRSRPIPLGVVLHGKHGRVVRRGDYAVFEKQTAGGLSAAYLDRELIERACVAMGIQIVRVAR